jgi:teichoic acid transport system permease protein
MTTPATEPPLDTGAYQALFDASPKTTKVVTLANLTRVGARPPLRQYIALLWARRNFLWRDARARVGSNSRESVLGKLWLVLEPVINGLTYYLIFGVIMGASRGITNFLGYLVIGVFLFQFTSKCAIGGTRAVTANKNMIRAFTFPRAALPIAVVLRELLSYLWALAALAALIYLLPEEETFTWRVALVPVVLALQVMFTLGLALFLARWTVAIRDLATIVPLVTRIWLYASCVFFSFKSLEDRGLPTVYGAVMQYNPMFQVLDMVRDLVLYATIPDRVSWLILGGWAVGMLVVGFVSFWRAEESYGR